MKKIYILGVVAWAVVAAGCSHHAHDEHGEHDEEEENPMVVHFGDELQKTVDFKVVTAEKKNIGNVVETVAQVEASQMDESVICAKADGVVSLKGRSLTIGSAIASGQTICTINASATANNNLTAQQQTAKAEYERAKAEYERLEILREDKLALESDLVNAKAAMESALAQLKALRKGFAGGNQNVTSSTSGYLKQLLVKDGQYVQAGAEIAVVSKSQTLQLKAEVPVSYYSILKNIYDANITLPAGAGVGDERETVSLLSLGGRMLSYGHQTSTDSPLVPVTFEIKNVVDVVPGTFVDMFIKTASAEEKICVPAEAVMEEMGNWFVYVQTEPEHFEKRQVKIGASDGIDTEIVSGVKEKEKVVGRGAILVKLQQSASSVDAHAGHSH